MTAAARHTARAERALVEQCLPARDRPARLVGRGRPLVEEGEDAARGRLAGLVHEAVDRELKRLVDQRPRTPGRPLGVEGPDPPVVRLRGEQHALEVDDRPPLLVAERGALPVGVRGAGGLREQIAHDRAAGAGLAAVPHHAGEELQIGHRQRAAKQRQLGRAREFVRIVDPGQLELGPRGDGQSHPDQPPRQHQRVRTAARLQRRHVGARRDGGVVRPEQRIEPAGRLEPALHRGGNERPAIDRSVARGAGPAGLPETAKERMIGRHPAAGRERDGHPVGVGRRHEGRQQAGPGRDRRHEEERQQRDREPGRHAV